MGIARKSKSGFESNLSNAHLPPHPCSDRIKEVVVVITATMPLRAKDFIANRNIFLALCSKVLRKYLYAYKSQTHSEANPHTLETWLLNCAKAIPKFLYLTVTSINISAAGDDSTEW
ncbi:MAG: hypothetical protein IGS49_17680 [Chlorogloeopsis fritschii C42_A2020_084]|uniref:hypothetical protein n=1 Tax=Chlorogloeopsis fritschii TaxID=1124 RepID=UPI0019F52DF1|nr:hypothetical protein [Chlorogloeopsis fritschii]MBF2007239.1 hypothetical protein [Chlorogloeopsis fritschii C42_A2020_084]